jgi:cation transport regulator ChaC/alpha-tubulin suppressor-like RCC1 family protein
MSASSVLWNKERGIWVDSNGNACCKVVADLDKDEPMYVFGYGSLIWRPGDLLEQYESYQVDAISYQRLFAQRSYDHRGTPNWPGLVLTVHPVDEDNKSDSHTPSTCSGRVFLVPEADREEVLKELDFREKGGYTRTVMNVRMREDQQQQQEEEEEGNGREAPYAAGAVFRAIVYYAEQSNPLFFSTAADTSAKGIHATANIIAAAEGPSGHNSAYLLQLSHYLYSNSPSPLTDNYLISLSRSVYCRTCPWSLRARGLLGVALHCVDDPMKQGLSGSSSSGGGGGVTNPHQGLLTVQGWGSNEYVQLSSVVASPAVPTAVDVEVAGLGLGKGGGGNLNKATRKIHSTTLLAGGGSSGYVDSSSATLHLWGQLIENNKMMMDGAGTDTDTDTDTDTTCVVVPGVVAACLGHSHGLALHSSGVLLSFGDDSYQQCSGGPPDLCIPLAAAPSITEEELGPPSSSVAKPRVWKAACGMRHSAAISGDGKLYTWGSARHGQVVSGDGAAAAGLDAKVLSQSVPSPPPEEGEFSVHPRFTDVACGAKHTVAVDNRGAIWTFGDNKHGALGRDIASPLAAAAAAAVGRVSGLPTGVKWVGVASGWAHVVARGVRQDGSVVFWCWGRCDLGQLPTATATTTGQNEEAGGAGGMLAPSELLPLPPRQPSGQHRMTVGVWCGNEHTVAADEEGCLWYCGWDDHSTGTGCGTEEGDNKQTTDRRGGGHLWKPVMAGNGSSHARALVSHGTVVSGHVAAGGAHTIFVCGR